jgi:calcium/calmodulin-dependent protein kinase I
MNSPDEASPKGADLSPPRSSPSHPGFRERMRNHSKERVIAYASPAKESRRVDHIEPLQDSDKGESPIARGDQEEDPARNSTPSLPNINGIHPQMVISRLKPLQDDVMNFYGNQGSISQLSFTVNDAAGGKSFASCYEKRDVLGEGGFAVVYRCFHFERQHTYAVKEILTEDYEFSGENLREEIDALKRLRDIPYIVRLMDVFNEYNVCYVVMEEMRGGDLLERLGEIEVFDEIEGRQVSRRLLDAVYYCHKKNIVHRDIKPENILMTSRENNTGIKLADFGCSRRFEPGTHNLFTLCGSPQYVAPELYKQNDTGYDERCDLWSAAVVIYVIMGGYAPFDGEDHELPGKICEGFFEFHDEYWAGVSDPPKEVIRSLLQVNPQERATLEDALDSEWLRRRDREKLESSKNMDGSLTSFEAWCKSQNSDYSLQDTHHSTRPAALNSDYSLHDTHHSTRPAAMEHLVENDESDASLDFGDF